MGDFKKRLKESAEMARKQNASSVIRYARQFSRNNKSVEEKILSVIGR